MATATALDFHEDWLVCSLPLLSSAYNVSTMHHLSVIIIRQQLCLTFLSVFYFTFQSAVHKEEPWEHSMTSLSRHTQCSFLPSIRLSVLSTHRCHRSLSWLCHASSLHLTLLPYLSFFSMCQSFFISASAAPSPSWHHSDASLKHWFLFFLPHTHSRNKEKSLHSGFKLFQLIWRLFSGLISYGTHFILHH